MPDKPYLSIREVCERFGVDYKTIYRQIQAGELSASKVGGVYRIREEDVATYFERRRAQPRESIAPANDIEAVMASERIDVVLPDEARAIAEERLAEAQERLRSGQVDVLVTSLQAKQREVSAINRFDRKLRELVSLKLPDGRMLRQLQPDRYLTQHDQSEELMQALNVSYLERAVVDRLPLNLSRRLTLPDESGKRTAVVIEMAVWSDLSAHARDGFTARRVGLAELLPRLNEAAAVAEKERAPYILGLASTSGWSDDAQACVDASDGTSYTHHLLMPILIDLTRNSAIYDRRDTRIEPYVGLFLPTLHDERVVAIMRVIEDQFSVYDTLPVSDLIRITGAGDELTRAAIERLIGGGKYRRAEEGDVGAVLTTRKP